MAKFCGKCGAKLDETTGRCPKCCAGNAENLKNRKADKRQKEVPQESERAEWSAGKKIRRFCLKLLFGTALILLLTGGAIVGLFHFNVLDISAVSNFNKEQLLPFVNERAIEVKETNIVMDTDTEGTAEIIVQMPNYTLLFREAAASNNPEKYLLEALALGRYEVQEFVGVATVTVDDEITTVHSDEMVHRLLEESLVDAINALWEVEE